MVRLALERAPGAEVVLATAERPPFAEASFTAVAMSMVLFFLDDPVAALRECHRVLVLGGRIAIYTSSPGAELVAMVRRARFSDAAVRDDDGGQLLTARRPPPLPTS